MFLFGSGWLSFPYALRYRLAYDAPLVSDVLAIFTKTVFVSLIRRAREFGAVRKAQCGAVTFIQRFGSALNLNLHLHMLAIDGVFAADEDGHPQFQVLLAPDDEEVGRLTASLAEGITKSLQRRGLGPDSDPEESDRSPLARSTMAGGTLCRRRIGQGCFRPECRAPCHANRGSDRSRERGLPRQSTQPDWF